VGGVGPQKQTMSGVGPQKQNKTTTRVGICWGGYPQSDLLAEVSYELSTIPSVGGRYECTIPLYVGGVLLMQPLSLTEHFVQFLQQFCLVPFL